jgi:hypothetical protein
MLHALNAPLKPKFGAGDVDDQTIIGTAPCQNAGWIAPNRESTRSQYTFRTN